MSRRKSLADALKQSFRCSNPDQDQYQQDPLSNKMKRRSVIDALPSAFMSTPYIEPDDKFADIKLGVRPAPREPTYEPDYNIMSESVISLDGSNFDHFVRGKEKALVMFYKNFQCPMADFEADFASVAEDSRNEKHGYGAVDCVCNRDLCAREKVCCTPALKLYSNGFEVGNVIKAKEMTAGQMSMMVKMTPILTKPKIASENAEKKCAAAKKRVSMRW